MKQTKRTTGIIPMIAKKMGEKSADAACSWWAYQPKVPTELKKAK